MSNTHNFKERHKGKKSRESLCHCLHAVYQERQPISAMAHEWFLMPKLMPPDRQGSCRTLSAFCAAHSDTKTGFQMKTTAGFSVYVCPSLRPCATAVVSSPRTYEKSRSLTLQGKGQTGLQVRPEHCRGRHGGKWYKGMSF